MASTMKSLSLICHCGHAYDDHDNSGFVEGKAPECEFYGFNEEGGLDEHGTIHCLCHVDGTLPDIPRRTQIPKATEEQLPEFHRAVDAFKAKGGRHWLHAPCA